MKCVLYRLDNKTPFAPFVEEAVLVHNQDGSVSFQLPAGGFAGQEPRQYGVRHDQHDADPPKQYQRATLTGNIVVFLTRPEDPPMAYLYAQGKVY